MRTLVVFDMWPAKNMCSNIFTFGATFCWNHLGTLTILSSFSTQATSSLGDVCSLTAKGILHLHWNPFSWIEPIIVMGLIDGEPDAILNNWAPCFHHDHQWWSLVDHAFIVCCISIDFAVYDDGLSQELGRPYSSSESGSWSLWWT